MKYLITILSLTLSTNLQSQNIGIGTATPNEKLEVEGKVFSNQGGFKFPDGTTQVTAAIQNSNYPEAGTVKQYIVMEMLLDAGGQVPGMDSLLIGVDDGVKILDFEFTNALVQGVIIKDGFRFVKNIDQGSPTIALGFYNNDLFDAVFHFTEELGQTNQAYYKISITDGAIVGYTNNSYYLGNGEWSHLEEIKIDYNQIEIEFISNGTTATHIFSGNPAIK